jgi:hypothetical protein
MSSRPSGTKDDGDTHRRLTRNENVSCRGSLGGKSASAQLRFDLYLNPPQHAAVFCVDEKTAILALDRKASVLPLSPGRAERHGFEYYRHDTLSLYAAFNTQTGEVLGKTADRHTSAEFLAFLANIVTHQPAGKEIHVIANNLSAHKTKQVHQSLGDHPNVHILLTRLGGTDAKWRFTDAIKGPRHRRDGDM